MEQPEHFRLQSVQATPRRFVSIGVVVAIHLVAIWAFATGLASKLIYQADQIIKVEVVKEAPPKAPKTPPPPPPELQKPPPPFVPPPDLNLQQEVQAAAPTVVTTVTPPPVATKPAPPPVTQPASIGKPHECQSKYPQLAMRLSHQGKVGIGMTIEADGSVSNVHVTQPSGFDELDQGAVACAGSWHYKPALQNGNPVAVQWQATVQYRLTGG